MTLCSKNTYDKYVYDFMKDIYVVCPSCAKQAIIRCPDFSFKNNNEQKIKLVCTKCGHSKRLDEIKNSVLSYSSNKITKGRIFIIGGVVDPYFHLPLWLTIECCRNILWVYNYEHLEFLRVHVQAKPRERNIETIAKKSIGSRLPKWLTSKKNREAVLKCIEELKKEK